MKRTKRYNLQKHNLLKKYRALFLNLLEFEGLDYGVKSYLMNKLLYNGKVAAFKLKTSKHVDSQLGFGTYAIREWDWKNKPIWLRIINEHQSPLIPEKELRNDKDAVILELDFIPDLFIREYVDRILDIEATIKTNLTVHKLPWVIKSSDNKTINAIKNLLRGESIVWVDDINFEIVEGNAPYIIDKLQLYKSEVEAELLSVLGIDNVKFEKKAQMTVDEVNSNADEIDAYRTIIREKVESFFNQIENVLGIKVTVKEDEDEVFIKGEDLNEEL